MRKLLAAILAAALLLCLCPTVLADGQVTDTLTVKVGYYGMQTENYVEIGTYHWSQLYEDLPLYQAAYSFYRAGDDGTYRTVIDSAYGFYITDLMDYVGIYTGDIQSIQFYTRDQSIGYFTSFTASELFQTQRYFFNDLSAHLLPTYDADGNLTGYDSSSAWNDCQTVAPMLALEDSWMTYEIGTEHTAPNYTSLGTGNRFRLLFGQSYPTETRTNQSAKYTHTLYVTLQGAPTVRDGLTQLDGTIGSHTASFDVTVGNSALFGALSSLLGISSSDGSVLEITGVTVTPSTQYSDLATVQVAYTVHKAGSASLSVSFGGTAVAQTPALTAHEPAKPDTPAEPSNSPQPAANTGGAQNGSIGTQGSNSEAASSGTPVTAGSRIYLASDALTQQLRGANGKDSVSGTAEAAQPPVQAPEVTEEDDTATLCFTALGALAVCLIGALTSILYYRKERKQP